MDRRIKYLEELCANEGYHASIYYKRGDKFGVINYYKLREIEQEDFPDLFKWIEYRCLDERFAQIMVEEYMKMYGNYIPTVGEFKKMFKEILPYIEDKLNKEAQ